MSKSFDNYISIKESANDMYGKTMSISDGLIGQYFKLTTLLEDSKIEELRIGNLNLLDVICLTMKVSKS